MLGDTGYDGCAGVLTKFKRPQLRRSNGRISKKRVRYNRVHERVRNRIENVVRFVKRHALFAEGRAFTHSVEELEAVLKITGHLSARSLRQFQRFRSYGPWAH